MDHVLCPFRGISFICPAVLNCSLVLSSRPRFSICIAIFVAPTFRVFAWCKFNFQPSWLTRPHTHPAAPLNSLLFLYFFFDRIYFYTFFFRWSLVTDHSTSFSTLVTHATWFLATAAIHLVFLIPIADKRIVEQLRLEKPEKSV